MENIIQTKLAHLTFKSPVFTASGTYGYADEYDDFLDVSEIGAIVTKAISLKPREGNKHTRIIETQAGMINSIGLENLGIEGFLEKKLPVLRAKNIDFIMNIAGSSMEEYALLGEICSQNNIKAIELNVSCPNVKSGCLEFGVSADSLYNLVSKVRENYDGFLIVKLTPNVTSIEELALACKRAGADCISAINTLKGLEVKFELVNGKFRKTKVQGGYSGVGIQPVALSMVNRIRQAVDLPIIGMGGIYTLEDMLKFFAVGADAIQIGTANFTYPDIAKKLQDELREYIIKNNFKDLDDLKNKIRTCFNEQ
ncbi:dihydroorotate dehydrogenase [bacterium]|nr:dihydroorotate dehydrogenase [bacterium]